MALKAKGVTYVFTGEGRCRKSELVKEAVSLEYDKPHIGFPRQPACAFFRASSRREVHVLKRIAGAPASRRGCLSPKLLPRSTTLDILDAISFSLPSEEIRTSPSYKKR